MKELKNKEVVIGLIVLIILSAVALVLIIKREFPQEKSVKKEAVTVTAREVTEEAYQEDDNGVIAADETVSTTKTSEQEDSQVFLIQKESMETLALNSQSLKVNEFMISPSFVEYTGDDMWQLEELYGYWKDYQLDAVDDLIRLPRVRTLTHELSETNRFYYYGDVNSGGLPHGSGLAVYADNAYYCGEWKNGKRHGNGMWLQIFPDKTVTLNGVPGVTEHSYNGQWQNDYPNGEGQEHISYDKDEMSGEYMVANVIGGFKDGYYDGSLYIMAFDKDGGTTDWEATAKKGVFTYYHERFNASGELPVWKEMIETDEDVFRWLDEDKNVNWGIFGLKKMN